MEPEFSTWRQIRYHWWKWSKFFSSKSKQLPWILISIEKLEIKMQYRWALKKIYIWFAWPVVTIHGCLDLNKIQTCNSENSSFKVFFVALVKGITVCELQGVIVNTAFMACLLSFTRNHCLFTLLPVELSRIWRSETAVGDNSTLNNPLST